MKKIVSTLLVFALATSVNVYAEDVKEKTEKSVKMVEQILKSEQKLSIESAMKLAELKTLKDPLYKEKLKELDKVKEDNAYKYGEPERKVDDNGNAYYKYPKGEPQYNVIQQILDMEESLEDNIKAARNSARNLYFSIIDAKQNIEIAKGKLEIAQDDLEKAKTKYTLGTITSSEVVAKQSSLATAKSSYENSKNTVTSLYSKLELATDIYKNYNIKIEDLSFDISSLLNKTSQTYVGFYVLPSNLDQKTMDAYQSIEELNKQLKDKEEALKNTVGGYNEDSLIYYNKTEELEIKTLKDQIKEAQNNLNIDFAADSQKLTDSIENFQNIQSSKDLAEKKHNQNILKYSNGQITKSEFLKSGLTFEEAKIQYNKSLKDLYVLVDNYNDKYNLQEETKE